MFTLLSIAEASLTTPTSAQRFPLGAIISVQEPFSTTACIKRYVYAQAPVGGCTAYNAYLIDFTSTAASEVVAGTPATSSVYRWYAVAPVTFTASYYGWFQIEGQCTATSTTDTTIGNTGKCANGVTTVTDEAAATISASSIGMWLETGTGSGDRSLLLFGHRATVA